MQTSVSRCVGLSVVDLYYVLVQVLYTYSTPCKEYNAPTSCTKRVLDNDIQSPNAVVEPNRVFIALMNCLDGLLFDPNACLVAASS